MAQSLTLIAEAAVNNGEELGMLDGRQVVTEEVFQKYVSKVVNASTENLFKKWVEKDAEIQKYVGELARAAHSSHGKTVMTELRKSLANLYMLEMLDSDPRYVA